MAEEGEAGEDSTAGNCTPVGTNEKSRGAGAACPPEASHSDFHTTPSLWPCNNTLFQKQERKTLLGKGGLSCH